MTARAAWLGLVVCVLVLSAAVPLREYLSQRGEISRLQAQQAQQRQRVAALEQRERALKDPAVVQQLARQRFGYVKPGETNYVVLRPGDDGAPQPQQGQAAPTGPEAPWYSQLWGSVRAADRPKA